MEQENFFTNHHSSKLVPAILVASLFYGCAGNTIKLPSNLDDPKNCQFLGNKEYPLHEFLLCDKYQGQINKNIIKTIEIRLPWCKTIQEEHLIRIRKCVKREEIGVPDFCINKEKKSRC
jgi:hypothetical protein